MVSFRLILHIIWHRQTWHKRKTLCYSGKKESDQNLLKLQMSGSFTYVSCSADLHEGTTFFQVFCFCLSLDSRCSCHQDTFKMNAFPIIGHCMHDIVTRQRGGVSSEPLWLRAATRHGPRDSKPLKYRLYFYQNDTVVITLPKVQSSQHRFFCWKGCLRIIHPGLAEIFAPDGV